MSKVYFAWVANQKGGFAPQKWYGAQGMKDLPPHKEMHELNFQQERMTLEQLVKVFPEPKPEVSA